MAITNNGTKLFIGTTKPIVAVPGDFTTGETYKELKGLTNINELGGEYETGTVDRIDTGIREKFKGTKELGEIEATFTYIPGDQGMAAAEAAYASNLPYNFYLQVSNLDKYYVRALVMSTKIVVGSSNEAVSVVVKLARTDLDAARVAA